MRLLRPCRQGTSTLPDGDYMISVSASFGFQMCSPPHQNVTAAGEKMEDDVHRRDSITWLEPVQTFDEVDHVNGFFPSEWLTTHHATEASSQSVHRLHTLGKPGIAPHDRPCTSVNKPSGERVMLLGP